MPVSKDFGRFFVLTIKVVTEAGWVWTAPTFEIEPPFRVCHRCLVVRFKPFRTALVLGWWHDSDLEEDDALRQALSARSVDLEEPSELDSHRRSVREHIAAHTEDLDQEWRLLAMLGLDRDEAS